jgi:hypothetical protein
MRDLIAIPPESKSCFVPSESTAAFSASIEDPVPKSLERVNLNSPVPDVPARMLPPRTLESKVRADQQFEDAELFFVSLDDPKSRLIWTDRHPRRPLKELAIQLTPIHLPSDCLDRVHRQGKRISHSDFAEYDRMFRPVLVAHAHG